MGNFCGLSDTGCPSGSEEVLRGTKDTLPWRMETSGIIAKVNHSSLLQFYWDDIECTDRFNVYSVEELDSLINLLQTVREELLDASHSS